MALGRNPVGIRHGPEQPKQGRTGPGQGQERRGSIDTRTRIVNRMPQRGIGLQPKVAELARLPWVTIRKWIQPQRGCGKGRARVKRRRNGRNRVAVGNELRTVSQGSSCLATAGLWAGIPLGFATGWSRRKRGQAKAGRTGGRGCRLQRGFDSAAQRTASVGTPAYRSNPTPDLQINAHPASCLQ